MLPDIENLREDTGH